MSIFVGNLPFRAEREDVLQLFAPFGEVLNCSLPLERDTGRKRGFAFVEMADEEIESTAIDGLQGTELMGRPLTINNSVLQSFLPIIYLIFYLSETCSTFTNSCLNNIKRF